MRATMSTGSDRVEQVPRACGADRNFLAPPGTSSSSNSWMRLTTSVRPGRAASRRSTSSRNATGGVVGGDLPQPGGAQGGHRDAVGVDRVGLAALAGVEHPHLGGQLRRHVEDGFAVGDQALGDVPADAVAAFDGPDPIRVAAAGGQHRPVALGGRCSNRPCTRTCLPRRR